jgi:hypothetical protein
VEMKEVVLVETNAVATADTPAKGGVAVNPICDGCNEALISAVSNLRVRRRPPTCGRDVRARRFGPSLRARRERPAGEVRDALAEATATSLSVPAL